MLALSLKCPEGLLFGWVVFCLSAGFTDGTWEGLTGGGGGSTSGGLQLCCGDALARVQPLALCELRRM